MWPGVLAVSEREFKPNVTGVIYAHKALVKRYISSLREDSQQDRMDADHDIDASAGEQSNQSAQENEESKNQEPQTQPCKANPVSLADFIPICTGRMLTNGVEQKGKAVEIHHHLFDALWNIGSRQIDAAVLVPQEPADEEEQKQLKETLPVTDAPSDATKVEESKHET